MMKFSQCIAAMLLCMISVFSLQAQEIKVIRDFKVNTELGIEKNLFKNWKLGFETILKTEQNASEIDEIDLDLGVEYSPLKFLSLGTGYRYAFNHKSDGAYYSKHRFQGDASLDYSYSRFKVDYRIRYQNVDDDFFLYKAGTAIPRHILRNRIQLKYDIPGSKITPYLFTEHYGTFDKMSPFGMKLKSGLGLRYNLKKYGQLKLYYRIDRELNNAYPYTYYTLGAGYSYDF